MNKVKPPVPNNRKIQYYLFLNPSVQIRYDVFKLKTYYFNKKKRYQCFLFIYYTVTFDYYLSEFNIISLRRIIYHWMGNYFHTIIKTLSLLV